MPWIDTAIGSTRHACSTGKPAGSRTERVGAHQHPFGEAAVAADAEDRVLAAEVTEPARAQCTHAALVAGVDRHRGAVVEHTGELVSEHPRLRAVGEHVQVAAADARRLHVYEHAVGAFTRGGFVDVDAR